MLPDTCVRVSTQGHNVTKQLWNSSLQVDNEADQTIDFKHCKSQFFLTAKVRAANY